MKIQGTVADLLSACERAKRAINNKAVKPVLRCVSITPLSNDSLRVEGTDLLMGVSTKCKCKSVEPAPMLNEIGSRVCIDSDTLLSALKVNEGGEYTLEVLKAENGAEYVALKCGRSRYKLVVVPSDEYPAFPENKAPGFTQVPKLGALLTSVAFSASDVNAKYALACVRLESANNKLTAVASNGRAVAAHTSTGTLDGDKPILLPLSFVALVSALGIETIMTAGGTVFGITAWQNDITTAQTQVFAQLVDGAFPDWRKFTENVTPTNTMTVTRSALRAALSRIAFLDTASEATTGVEMAGENTLSLSTDDANGQHGDSTCDVSDIMTGASTDPFYFNPVPVLAMLNAVETETLRWNVSAPNLMVLSSENYQYVQALKVPQA